MQKPGQGSIGTAPAEHVRRGEAEAEGMVERAAHAAKDLASSAGERLGDYRMQAMDLFERRPMVAIAVGAAAGVAVGILASRWLSRA